MVWMLNPYLSLSHIWLKTDRIFDWIIDTDEANDKIAHRPTNTILMHARNAMGETPLHSAAYSGMAHQWFLTWFFTFTDEAFRFGFI